MQTYVSDTFIDDALDLRDYLRSRLVLFRPKEPDPKIGWLLETRLPEISVALDSRSDIELNSAYACRLFGMKNDLMFKARPIRITEGNFELEQGQSKIATLLLGRDPEVLQPKRPPRKLLLGVSGQIKIDGLEDNQVRILDISPKGVGIISQIPLTPGVKAHLKILQFDEIDLETELIYSERIEESGAFKCGLSIRKVDRLSKRYYHTLLENPT